MAAMKRAIREFWQSADKTNEPVETIAPDLTAQGPTYEQRLQEIRAVEYPTLVGTTYLDHAGTTPYAKSLIDSWTAELTTHLFGNPHSASAASQLSTRRIDDIRLKVLKFFKASPQDFDVVFVANATAAIKLVVDAFRDNDDGFWFGYHADAHTSLIGCREMARNGSKCFMDDDAVQGWISNLREESSQDACLRLFAYPGQSNFNGRRLPLSWSDDIRCNASLSQHHVYTLLDAASLVSTSSLDLSSANTAPDFVALSFYKIFGFPDLGALLVRKASSQILLNKRYFAGGTVDAVVNDDNPWYAKKTSVHAALEEGTLPFHNIIALDHAMLVHQKLFGSMEDLSCHTRSLAGKARKFLRLTRHANGAPICEIYGSNINEDYGPITAFNLKDSAGKFISAFEVEKLSIVKGIQLRTGGMCNPGGIARHLNLTSQQIRSHYDAGYRCGGENDLIDGRPTGAIRISFGAMSTESDLENFIMFIGEYYIERNMLAAPQITPDSHPQSQSFFIESMSVFPIKSCAAFKIPAGQPWLVTNRGLAWDREWCLVHEGTNVALSQKKYPRLSLLRPNLDLETRKLSILYTAESITRQMEVEIDEIPSTITTSPKACANNAFRLSNSKVCGDTIPLHIYTSSCINNFFSEALGVPCCLARCSRTNTTRTANLRRPEAGSTPSTSSPSSNRSTSSSKLMLSNESPMLIVSRSSVNELNRQIRQNALEKNISAEKVKPVSADSFRGNIIVAQHPSPTSEIIETPYCEDYWTAATIRPGKSDKTPADADVSAALGTSSAKYSVSSSPSATSGDTDESTTTTMSMPGSFEIGDETEQSIVIRKHPVKSRGTAPVKIDILGPCQRCQIVSIDQKTALTQPEPFSTMAKTRRKGDGRVWFGVHAALDIGGQGGGDSGLEEMYVQVGDDFSPRS